MMTIKEKLKEVRIKIELINKLSENMETYKAERFKCLPQGEFGRKAWSLGYSEAGDALLREKLRLLHVETDLLVRAVHGDEIPF